jgi:hypothetical protein
MVTGMHPAGDSAADHSFEAATAATLVSPAGGDGVAVYSTDVDPVYTVADKPNGGYLLALLGRVARDVGREGGGDGWEVVSSSITYLRPPELGPAEIHATVLRRGRSAAHVRTVLRQGAVELVDAVSVVSEVPPAGTAVRYDDTVPLQAVEPDRCVRVPPETPTGMHVPMMGVIDLRFDPATMPFRAATEGTPKAELRGWTRFADGREPDALSLLFFIDAIPPATFMIGSSGWVPTLQMSAYVRAVPAPGWMGIRMAAHVVAGGMADETCTVWDSSGRVVVQGTQLARVRFPDEVA